MNSNIYIIEKSTGDSYEHWDHPVGWVESEEAAKEAVRTLTEKEPKCPFDEKTLKDFEGWLFEWSDIQNMMEEKLWAANPYQDGSEFRRPTDKAKYNEYMANVDRQIKEARKGWFERNAPAGYAEKLEAYDAWDDVRYDNPSYSYYSVPKLK